MILQQIIQEITYQIPSKLPEFCRSYYKKIFGLFFRTHCRITRTVCYELRLVTLNCYVLLFIRR